MTRRGPLGVALATAIALSVAAGPMLGCGPPPLHEDLPEPGPMAPTPEPPAPELLACQAHSQSFVRRTLPWLHGRYPLGSQEVEVLAQLVDAADSAQLDGRRRVAEAMAVGPEYRRRWQAQLFDLLRTRRDGHRTLLTCHGETGPAALTPELARFVLARRPTEPYPGGPWTMRDLADSSLLADDLRPVLLADVLVRMTSPIDDANTSADDLERARRTNFGRSFEAVYLGRRLECHSCHNDEGSVTDHSDPQLDRFWPVASGLERLVLPATEDELHAVFRWEGFGGVGIAPWGSEGCGTFSDDREGDRFGEAAWLGGPLPSGAHAIDLVERLREGFVSLHRHGFSAHPIDGSHALAQLVVLHWVDGLWASATGRRLTLDHGSPRNAAQAERLRRLAITLVDSEYSLRAVLVEIAVDLHLDQAAPQHCEASSPEPLPPIFDPFATENGAGHLVHRRNPLALVDEAHRVLGSPLPGQVFGQPGFDPALIGALGAHLRDVQPGHDGIDLFGVLAWEQALPTIGEGPSDAAVDDALLSVPELVREERRSPSHTVGTLALAIKDRVLADPKIDAQERPLVEALLELSWDRSLVDVDEATVHAAALRYARTLMATPQFMLSGLSTPLAEDDERAWVHPMASALSACERWRPRVLPEGAIECDDDGVVLP